MSFLCGAFFAQGALDYNYQLVYVDHEKIYYSIIQNDGDLYFGTNKGVYVIDDNLKLVEHDQSVKGPININLGSDDIKIKFKNAPKACLLESLVTQLRAFKAFKIMSMLCLEGLCLYLKTNRIHSSLLKVFEA